MEKRAELKGAADALNEAKGRAMTPILPLGGMLAKQDCKRLHKESTHFCQKTVGCFFVTDKKWSAVFCMISSGKTMDEILKTNPFIERAMKTAAGSILQREKAQVGTENAL